MKWIAHHWHRLVTHRFGWQKGHTTAWTRNDGVVMVAHQCWKCSKLTKIRPAEFNVDYRKP